MHSDGHFIHAVATSPLSAVEFIEYEVAHAVDARVRSPLSELLEISSGACENITMEDMKEVIRRRSEVVHMPRQHRCAIVLSCLDAHSWDLAKFYEGMVMLHSPETVIVFAQADMARRWLGFQETPVPRE